MRAWLSPILALAALSAGGCVSIAQFASGGPTATLRYVVPPGVTSYTKLWYVDRTQCPATAHISQLYATSSWHRDGTAGGSGTHVLTIPAAAPFMFHLYAQRGVGYTCDNGGVFRPEPGKVYELKYVIAPSPFLCIAQIRDLTRDSSGSMSESPDPTAHFFYPPDRNAGYCRIPLTRNP